MRAAKAGKRAPQLKVWCESCCIRVAPNEEHTVVRGKTYHRHCYSKISTKPSGRSKSLRILIVDDHAVVRVGLRELFSRRPSLQVVSEAANGVEAISQAIALQPDVIVMDVSMPQMNGIEATRQIHGALPHIRIVGLSTYDDEHAERAMREVGAEAYFTKNDGAGRLLDHLLSFKAQAKGSAQN